MSCLFRKKHHPEFNATNTRIFYNPDRMLVAGKISFNSDYSYARLDSYYLKLFEGIIAKYIGFDQFAAYPKDRGIKQLLITQLGYDLFTIEYSW